MVHGLAFYSAHPYGTDAGLSVRSGASDHYNSVVWMLL